MREISKWLSVGDEAIARAAGESVMCFLAPPVVKPLFLASVGRRDAWSFRSLDHVTSARTHVLEGIGSLSKLVRVLGLPSKDGK